MNIKKIIIVMCFFLFQNTFAGEYQEIKKFVSFFEFGPENFTFNKQVQDIIKNIIPHFLSDYDYKLNYTEKSGDRIFINAYILSIIFWERLLINIISYLESKDEEKVNLNSERKILLSIKQEKIRKYQYISFFYQRLSSVLKSELKVNTENVFSVIKNNLRVYDTDFISNRERTILGYFHEEMCNFYIKNFVDDTHDFSNELINEKGPGPDREIFNDLTPFYGNLLIKIVHGWFIKNIDNEAEFIKGLLGQKLYKSLVKKVKQNIEPKSEIKVSNFDRFLNSPFLNFITNNKVPKIKDIIEHMNNYEGKFSSFRFLNMAFSAGVVNDKNDSIVKFKKLLEDTNFILENLNFSLLEENFQNEKPIKKQPTKKQKPRKNNKTKEEKEQIETNPVSHEDLGLYQPHKIQEILKNNPNGFTKPKNFKNKNNQRKRYVIKNQVNIGQSLNEDLLNKEEISHLYLELDKANQDIFSSITGSLEELRKLILLLSGKKLFNKKELFDLVNKYKIALFFFSEGHKDKDLSFILNKNNMENFLLPNIEKKEISLTPVPKNIVFEIELMLNPLINNAIEDQAESYYLYKEDIVNNNQFILTHNSIKFDDRELLKNVEPFLNNSLALKQLSMFHKQLVNRYWRLQVIIAEHLLAYFGVINNPQLVEKEVLQKWQNFFLNLLNTSINWQEFCKEMTVKLEDSL